MEGAYRREVKAALSITPAARLAIACHQRSLLSSTSWLRRLARPSVSAMRAREGTPAGFASLRPPTETRGLNGADDGRFGKFRQRFDSFIFITPSGSAGHEPA
jgi:hypothetical protein